MAQMIAEAFLKVGVERVYGIIGTSILDLVDVMYDYKDRIDFVTTRHEQVAVSAADAEFRVKGKLAAAAVHAGPGFLNTAISLGIALRDRVPLIMVTGGVRRRLKGTEAWLEVDQGSIARALAKYYGRVDVPSDITSVLEEALKSALTPPFGPAVVEVPEDLWGSEAGDLSALEDLPRGPASLEGLGSEARTLASMLLEARKPVILACGELTLHPGFKQEDLLALAEVSGAYIVTSGNGRGACPEDHPRCLGRIGFGGGSVAADKAFESSDFVLVLGGELDDITTYAYTMLPQGEAIVVSVDPAVKKRPRLYEVYEAQPHKALKEILDEFRKISGGTVRKDEWDREVAGYVNMWNSMLESAASKESERANPNRFFKMLDSFMPRERIVSGGQGTHILYAYDYIRVYKPGSWLAATNLGAMGYALPAVIGAAKASPYSYIITVIGDGDLMMTAQDLETIVRERLDVKILLVNDDSYRVLYLRQVLQKRGRIYETLLGNPDFRMLAESFGFKYVRVERKDDEKKGLEALASKGPILVELKVDRDDVPPLNLEYTLRMSM
ncbi:MAG: thiamine pyrophosphate-binding protein [Desulfurococcales archaeon]|nr:thiamine pyrophosphate-binding protein [Desulfurococcales archaeon]